MHPASRAAVAAGKTWRMPCICVAQVEGDSFECEGGRERNKPRVPAEAGTLVVAFVRPLYGEP